MTPKAFIKSRKLRASNCPQCQKVLSGVTGVSGDPEGTIPVEGTISVCCYCGTLLVFTASVLGFASQEMLDSIPQLSVAIIQETIRKPIVVRSCPSALSPERSSS